MIGRRLGTESGRRAKNLRSVQYTIQVMEYHDSRVKKLDDPLLTRARPTSWTARSFFLSLFKSFFFLLLFLFFSSTMRCSHRFERKTVRKHPKGSHENYARD